MFFDLELLRDTYGTANIVVYGAFFLGLFFGVIAEISRYCMRAAVVEWVAPSQTPGNGHFSRIHTQQVALAILTALVGVQLLNFFGVIQLSESIYWAVSIRPIALIAGGIIFGIGMVLSGGCASRLLVLAASGNTRSLTTLLVAAIAAYATLRGFLSYPRIALEELYETGVSIDQLAADNALLINSFGLIIALVAAYFIVRSYKDIKFKSVTTGLFIGLLVIGGWLLTGYIGADEFEPTQVASFSFVAPIAEGLQFLMTSTGDTIRFGSALVGGVLVGAFTSALAFGRFKFKGFETEQSILRYLTGGLLMGFGGVSALGCTMGQGLSGLSTAAPTSILAFTAIIAGAYGAQKILSISALKTKKTAANHMAAAE